jgi:predicted heme/steroid binding protein
MRKFKKDELAGFNGIDAKPAYVAYKGRVYDVSTSWHWKGGKHQALHKAGEDMTDALNNAPHGEDLLGRVHMIGLLVEEQP